MKVLHTVLIISIFLQINANNLTEIWKKLRLPHVNKCMCSSKVNFISVQIWLTYNRYSNNPFFKSFLNCIGMSLNLIDELGIIDQELIVKKYKVSKEVVARCTYEIANIADLGEKNLLSGKLRNEGYHLRANQLIRSQCRYLEK